MNNIGNEEIEALRKKKAAINAALAAATVRHQKAKAKLEAREFVTIGEALVRYASQSPEFKTMLRQVLPVAAAVLDDAARKFLTVRGWF